MAGLMPPPPLPSSWVVVAEVAYAISKGWWLLFWLLSCRFAVLFLDGREGVDEEGGAATIVAVPVAVAVVAVVVVVAVASSAITRS